MVSWGGMVGAFLALLFIKYRWDEEILGFADVCTPGYFVGLGIGRVGCFFGGCCYGVHTDSCIGVTFTHPIAPASLMEQPVLPTQLISAAVLALVGVIFLFVLPRTRRIAAGFLFFSALAVYGIFRFTIEFWRADHRKFFLGLSDGQLYSIASLIIGAVGIVYLLRRRFSH